MDEDKETEPAQDSVQNSEMDDDKFIIDASLIDSSHCEVVILEDHVAAYDTCGGDEGESIPLDEIDLPEIQLHPEVEDEVEVNGEETSAANAEDSVSKKPDTICKSPCPEQPEETGDQTGLPVSGHEVQEVAVDREEGELTPEPAQLKAQVKDNSAKSPKVDRNIEKASDCGAQISKAFEEFCKRLEEIQAEAKRQSLELKRALTEKFKLGELDIESKDHRALLDSIPEPLKAVAGDKKSRKENQVRSEKPSGKHKDDKSKASDNRVIGRLKSKISDPRQKSSHTDDKQKTTPSSPFDKQKTTPSPFDKQKTDKQKKKDDSPKRQRREDKNDKENKLGAKKSEVSKAKDNEEKCVDCIAERTTRRTARSRSKESVKDRGQSRRFSRDRDRNRRPLVPARKENPRDRKGSRSRSRYRSGSSRARDRKNVSRDRSRNRKGRGSRQGSRDRRSRDRSRGRGGDSRRRSTPSPKRDRESSLKRSGNKETSHVSRRDLYLKNLEKKKRTNSVDKGVEKQRVRTLVKRQMQFISDVIDNPNPKASGGQQRELDLDDKTIIISSAKKIAKGNQNFKSDLKSLTDLDVMEKFLESLRNKNKENILQDDATYTRLMKIRSQTQEKILKHSGPYQSRISIRQSGDIDRRKDKSLFFSSKSSKPTSGSHKDNQKAENDEQEPPIKKQKPNAGEKNNTDSPITKAAGETPKTTAAEDRSQTKEEIKKSTSQGKEQEKVLTAVKKRRMSASSSSSSPLSPSPPTSSEISSADERRRMKQRINQRGAKAAKEKVSALSRSKIEQKKRLNPQAQPQKETQQKKKKHVSSDSSDSRSSPIAYNLRQRKKRLISKKESSEDEVPRRKATKYISKTRKKQILSEDTSEEDSESSVSKLKRKVRRQALKVPMKQKKPLKGRIAERETSSESSESDDQETSRKKVIVLSKEKLSKMMRDPKYRNLLLSKKSKHSIIIKGKKEKDDSIKLGRVVKAARRSEDTEHRSARRRTDSHKKEKHTLEEMETFLAQLREKRKDKSEEEHSELELPRESLRKESLFLDRHRAKRKAKLMACVAVTAKASAKEARFLEAMKKSKNKYQAEKEEIMRKLKAGSEAIISGAAPRQAEKIRAKSKERSPSKSERSSRSSSESDVSSKHEISRADGANEDRMESKSADAVTSDKGEELLNDSRGKKFKKPSSETDENKDVTD